MSKKGVKPDVRGKKREQDIPVSTKSDRDGKLIFNSFHIAQQ